MSAVALHCEGKSRRSQALYLLSIQGVPGRWGGEMGPKAQSVIILIY